MSQRRVEPFFLRPGTLVRSYFAWGDVEELGYTIDEPTDLHDLSDTIRIWVQVDVDHAPGIAAMQHLIGITPGAYYSTFAYGAWRAQDRANYIDFASVDHGLFGEALPVQWQPDMPDDSNELGDLPRPDVNQLGHHATTRQWIDANRPTSDVEPRYFPLDISALTYHRLYVLARCAGTSVRGLIRWHVASRLHAAFADTDMNQVPAWDDRKAELVEQYTEATPPEGYFTTGINGTDRARNVEEPVTGECEPHRVASPMDVIFAMASDSANDPNRAPEVRAALESLLTDLRRLNVGWESKKGSTEGAIPHATSTEPQDPKDC